MHLGRGPAETLDSALAVFYDDLLACLKDPAFRDGQWQLLEARRAWAENGTNDAFIAFAWTGPESQRRLVAVNYAEHQSQCYVGLPWGDLGDRAWRLQDRLGEATYDRDGAELAARGLYLDLPAWGYHAFEVQPLR
jgi:hypothetical protein